MYTNSHFSRKVTLRDGLSQVNMFEWARSIDRQTDTTKNITFTTPLVGDKKKSPLGSLNKVILPQSAVVTA